MQKSMPPERNAKRKRGNDLYYAVIDTNVLVSALLSRSNNMSAPAKIVEYLYQGQLVPVYNTEILEEYNDVLCRDKFHFDLLNIKTLINQIKEIGIHANRISSGESFPD